MNNSIININYCFHLGERCNSLFVLKENNILSGHNLFSGTYISFESANEIITNGLDTFFTNNVTFIISKLKTNEKKIDFFNCDDIDKNIIEKYITNNDFLFFNSENYYKDSFYSINLKYTDISNLLINDLYNYKNRYFVMPNNNFNDETFINNTIRRSKRFDDCLKSTGVGLLIYMDKLTDINIVSNVINNVTTIYKQPQYLFYIIPIYKNQEYNVNNIYSNITRINNIIFFEIEFPSLSYQLIHNPNDDNIVSYTVQYSKIIETIKNIFNFDNINKYY